MGLWPCLSKLGGFGHIFMLIVWCEEGAVKGSCPIPTSVGVITTTEIANRDKIKIKEKEEDRKEKSFPILFFFSPFCFKAFAKCSAEFRFAAFLSLFQMSFLKTDLSSQKRKVLTSEALWDWVQWTNIPSLHLFSLLPLSLWDGNRQVWHLQPLLCSLQVHRSTRQWCAINTIQS